MDSTTQRMMMGSAGAKAEPDGAYIAGRWGTEIRLYDHTTPGSLALAATYSTGINTNNRIGTLEFSPDDNYLLVTQLANSAVVLLDHTTRGSLALATTYDLGTALGTGARGAFQGCFVLGGNYVVVGHNRYLTMLDHTTPGTLTYRARYEMSVDNFAYTVKASLDGNYIAVGSRLNPYFTRFNVSGALFGARATYLLSTTVGNPPFSAFSPDQNYIAASLSPNRRVYLLNNGAGISVASFYSAYGTSGITNPAFSPDGNYIAVSSGYVLSSGDVRPRLTLLDHTTPGSLSLALEYDLPQSSPAGGLEFSPNGGYIVAKGTDLRLLYRPTSGSLSFSAAITGLSGTDPQVAFTNE